MLQPQEEVQVGFLHQVHHQQHLEVQILEVDFKGSIFKTYEIGQHQLHHQQLLTIPFHQLEQDIQQIQVETVVVQQHLVWVVMECQVEQGVIILNHKQVHHRTLHQHKPTGEEQ